MGNSQPKIVKPTEKVITLPPTNSSCYGAKGSVNDCYTCDDVVNAYKSKGWAYNTNDFAQCKSGPVPMPVPNPLKNSSCYGAKNGVNDCYTCDDVVNAYKANRWAYNTNDFAQCKPAPAPVKNSSCYGAKNGVNDCYTCDDVVNAYKANRWAYNTNDFAQCKPAPVPITTLAPMPITTLAPVYTTNQPMFVTNAPVYNTTQPPMINPKFNNLECPGGTQLIGNLCVGVPRMKK